MLTHKGTQTLHTPRLLLRRIQMEDAQAMYDNWASDPEVTKFLTWPTHSSVAITKQVIQSWQQDLTKLDHYQWIILCKDTSTAIGTIAVVELDEHTQKAEIGYCIGTAWWHQGYTSEALGAVINYLFAQVGINRIQARHDPRNQNSGAVMRKCGMQYEGTMRQSDKNNQGICDASYYGLLRSEWEKICKEAT